VRPFFFLVAFVIAVPAFAQSGAGSQDSSVNGQLRPRWGNYIVGVFPSPARIGEPITVQTYNHNPVELSVTIYDAAGREMLDLIPKQMEPGGLKTLTIPALLLSSGMYRAVLTTYTASGAIDAVDQLRFLIVH